MNATGQWEEGLEHGHGQCVTADGAAYDGQWEGGIRYGKCCLQSKLALALALAPASANLCTEGQPRSCYASLQAPRDIMSIAQIEHVQLSHLHIL